MAAINKEDVLKLAQLSRIAVSESEVERLQLELASILEYVEQLQDIDLSDVLPTYQVTGQQNVMREDTLKPAIATADELLKNAPATDGRYIKVKRMIT